MKVDADVTSNSRRGEGAERLFFFQEVISQELVSVFGAI